MDARRRVEHAERVVFHALDDGLCPRFHVLAGVYEDVRVVHLRHVGWCGFERVAVHPRRQEKKDVRFVSGDTPRVIELGKEGDNNGQLCAPR